MKALLVLTAFLLSCTDMPDAREELAKRGWAVLWEQREFLPGLTRCNGPTVARLAVRDRNGSRTTAYVCGGKPRVIALAKVE